MIVSWLALLHPSASDVADLRQVTPISKREPTIYPEGIFCKDGPDNLFVSIQKPNVDVHFTGVAKITENGIIGDDGTLRECDTIICATGFGMLY
jgi:cation diffusion facilitator CzcD-associated flavoprotein CzcO